MDHLNSVVRRVTDAVLDQSTREEIERAVVDGLVAADSYDAAWIGVADPGGTGVSVRESAGQGAPMDGESADVVQPALTAVQTGEVQVQLADEADAGERAAGVDGGSVAAIPIVHGESRYGVLTVHTERSDALSAEEREVIGQLGEIVGHAIAAVERKRALTADEVIEVEFVVEDAYADLPDTDGAVSGISFEQIVPVDEGRYHVYGTATEDGLAALEALPEVDESITDVRTISREGNLRAFELHQTEPPLASALATIGGTVASAEIEDGDFQLTVHVPPGVAVRTVKETVQDAYPGASLLAQRQVTRADETAHRLLSTLDADLTDRQRAILQTAYFGGYFEWPRGSTGEELAESLDIAPATFSQHLRTGQRRLFSVLFEGAVE